MNYPSSRSRRSPHSCRVSLLGRLWLLHFDVAMSPAVTTWSSLVKQYGNKTGWQRLNVISKIESHWRTKFDWCHGVEIYSTEQMRALYVASKIV